jgi:cytochrome c biogenesis protein CcdA
VLPLFPSYLSFITGMSVERLSGEVTAGTRGRVVLHSLAFIAGFTAVFVSLGVSVSAAGQFLLDYRDWIRIAGGILIIVFGLYIMGILRLGSSDARPSSRSSGSRPASSDPSWWGSPSPSAGPHVSAPSWAPS